MMVSLPVSFEDDGKKETHNGGDGELLLLSILEETQDIVTDDDASLAVQLFKDTHYEDLYELFSKVEICKNGKRRRSDTVQVGALYREAESGI